MPTDPRKLAAIAAAAIQDAIAAGDWGEAETLIRRAHRAAYLAGLSERLGVPLNSALLSEKRLSRAERADIEAIVNEQLKYLRGFENADGLTDAQTEARAAMYGRATRGTYSKARWADWDLPYHPTEGSECMSNCLCHWTVDDHGDGTGSATWHLGATERHCTTCPTRAQGSPYTVERR